MGFFTVEGSSDFGKTWMEETTEPAADLRQATELLRQDLSNTASPEMTRRTLALWDTNKGEAVVTDTGKAYNLDPIHWRFRFSEN
jgi:hypothetical protein